jgi:hypothetical protein
MAEFPTRESDIIALALKLIEGFTENPDVFPSPPVTPEQLRATLERFKDADEAAAKASGAARDAHVLKDEILEELTDQMRSKLKYAESVAGREEGKLSLVGWAGRRSGSALEPPEEPRGLEIVKTGRNWLVLDWKEPRGGGQVAGYQVEVATREEGVWREAGMSLSSEKLVAEQQRGVELEYRVFSANRAGRSLPSNTVRVTL